MQIKEPTCNTEFEVQAFVYSQLRMLGINARGEVKVPYHGSANRKAVCRFDIAIFEDGYLAGIVEIKSSVIKHKTPAGWTGTRQGMRYSNFGVPVLIIYGMSQAEKFVEDTRLKNSIDWNMTSP